MPAFGMLGHSAPASRAGTRLIPGRHTGGSQTRPAGWCFSRTSRGVGVKSIDEQGKPMGLPHPSRRAGRTATGVLLALSAAGTITASVLAYSDSHATNTTTGTGSADSSTSNGASTENSGTAPQLSNGSGSVHAQSSGS